MGKPAARLTDMTAHGGTIVGPGVPTVLIGKLPAATLLDNHVCPMVTGVVPHVGGPMTLGSMGVFIGKKPAGRVGDMKVCVGPPSLVMMGCFTVLIGEAGGGGGGSAGSAAAADAAKVKGPGSISPFPAIAPDPGAEPHSCFFRFTDSAGLPLAGIPYLFQGPDNAERAGSSAPDGTALYSGFTQAGAFKVTAMVLKDAKWSKAKAPVGEEIELSVAADGFKDGTPGEFTVLKRDSSGGQLFLGRVLCKVEGKKLKAKWTIDVDGAAEPPALDKAKRGEEYCQFIAHAAGAVTVSGRLDVHTDLEIEMVDEIGQPLEKQKVEVVLANGEVKNLTLDDQGKALLPMIPAAPANVTLLPPAPVPPGTEKDSYLDSLTDLKRGCRDDKGRAAAEAEKAKAAPAGGAEPRGADPAKLKGTGTTSAYKSHVFDLQQDLNDLGFPINGLANGDFDAGTEAAVKVFQSLTKTGKRRFVAGKPVLVSPSYGGEATGVVDDATKKEMRLWKDKQYRRNEAILYVKRDGKEVPVEDPSHIVPGPPEEKIAKKGKGKGKGEKPISWSVVFAKGTDGVEVALGKLQVHVDRHGSYTGLGNVGKHNLYECLFKPATEKGIPALSDSDKAIWASLYQSEGSLEAVNQYDSAFLSFGPMQQTMGTRSDEGELAGALEYVKTMDAVAYKKYFGDIGLEPVQVGKRSGKGYFSLDGRLIKATQDKEEYRRFIWAYRCITAMKDNAFRKPFLEFGFHRLERILKMEARIGSQMIEFKDVYKSELARALVLDAHINIPNKVEGNSGMWVDAMTGALAKDKDTGAYDIAGITGEDEYKIIREFLELRKRKKMTNAELRSEYIILCCKDFADETKRTGILEKLGFDSEDGFLATVKSAKGKASSSGKSAKAWYYDLLSVPVVPYKLAEK